MVIAQNIPGIKLGQKANISVEALPGVKLEGKVSFISPVSKEEAGVVVYQGKVSFEAPESLGLKSGMSATADIVTAQRQNVLTLPSKAIARDRQGRAVVKVAGGQTEETTIVTGISDGNLTEIISGLEEGNTVLRAVNERR